MFISNISEQNYHNTMSIPIVNSPCSCFHFVAGAGETTWTGTWPGSPDWPQATAETRWRRRGPGCRWWSSCWGCWCCPPSCPCPRPSNIKIRLCWGKFYCGTIWHGWPSGLAQCVARSGESQYKLCSSMIFPMWNIDTKTKIPEQNKRNILLNGNIS